MSDRKPADADAPLASGRVLVIDDDYGIGDCVEMLLTRAGHACVVTRCGQDGLAQLRSEESSGANRSVNPRTETT